MLKTRHLLHPWKTIRTVRDLLAAHRDLQRFAQESERRFRGDPRYRLDDVSAGFALHAMDEEQDDDDLLTRICDAYLQAAEIEKTVPEAYQATPWWQEVRRSALGPVMSALRERNLPALRSSYRNFYRDACSVGLVGRPLSISRAYRDGRMKDTHRRFLLGDALHRLDYWQRATDRRFPTEDLSGPMVGNPFGVVVGQTLIRSATEYQHYCAQRLRDMHDGSSAVIAEIGGGYGAMAHYLLRDWPGVTYLDFDVPESIALTSYYLMKSLPQLRFVLYGEQPITAATIAGADVILMPPWVLREMPPGSADTVFTSHTLSDTTPEATVVYLNDIGRVARRHFFYIGSVRGAETVMEAMPQGQSLLSLQQSLPSEWNLHRVPDAREVERIYRVTS
ncbi:putative sugar O-methyltransferase [Terriglobus sp. 2YAB30_2]|uniref:putative sugar O-methyltransferase n=1 Tax=unclassified Terriglobus TaxID=2628988 RepID=UPI003F987C00